MNETTNTRLDRLSGQALMTILVLVDGCDLDEMVTDAVTALESRYGAGATDRTADLFTGGHYSHEDMLLAIDTEWATVEAALRGEGRC